MRRNHTQRRLQDPPLRNVSALTSDKNSRIPACKERSSARRRNNSWFRKRIGGRSFFPRRFDRPFNSLTTLRQKQGRYVCLCVSSSERKRPHRSRPIRLIYPIIYINIIKNICNDILRRLIQCDVITLRLRSARNSRACAFFSAFISLFIYLILHFCIDLLKDDGSTLDALRQAGFVVVARCSRLLILFG